VFFSRLRNPKRPVDDLRSAEEIRWFYLSFVASLLGWYMFLRSARGIFWLIIFWVLAYFMHGLSLARIRGNGIRVTGEQFPEIYELLIDFSRKLLLEGVPEVYVMERPNFLNAFATRFLARDYVVLYSDLIEMAYASNLSALGFILAHELGHVALRHVQRTSWISLANFVPFVHQAHSRSCEKSADAVGAYLMPDGALLGMCSLGAGGPFLARIDPRVYASQSRYTCGIWDKVAESVATHPFIPHRLEYLESRVERAP
jgi:Zn-dependent protease with chaperone function